MAKKWIGGTIAAIFCMTSVLGGLEEMDWRNNCGDFLHDECVGWIESVREGMVAKP